MSEETEKMANRRLRLKTWFADKSIPPNEKSYISQLLNGKTPFGEKAAARLEKTLGMGTGYLDRAAGGWPFDIDYDLYDDLSPEQKANVNTMVCALISSLPKPQKNNGSSQAA